jgi:phosphatidylethanolamine-binding protein
MVGFTVSYNETVVKGQELSKAATKSEPSIALRLDPRGMYTVLMSDPDAPNPSWLHMLVVNIPGATPSIVNGTPIARYAPPSPPSGVHRYIFTLYEQPASIMVQPLQEGETRGGFNVADFERRYSLRKLKTVFFTVHA